MRKGLTIFSLSAFLDELREALLLYSQHVFEYSNTDFVLSAYSFDTKLKLNPEHYSKNGL